MIKYIELKTGHSDNGPAWIARVVISRSGQTLYFNDKALRRSGGQLISGNYFDISNGDEYWVSGVKKRGGDRHGAGSGNIGIEASAVAEYFEEVASQSCRAGSSSSTTSPRRTRADSLASKTRRFRARERMILCPR